MPPAEHLSPSSPPHDTRIEQLLLLGLDHYFAGEFERAIQVWSRVFFLDRGHPRARAYVDRARGALAERQREAEASLHRGDGPLAGLPDAGAMGASGAVESRHTEVLGDGMHTRPLAPGSSTFARPSYARATLASEMTPGVASRAVRARVVDVERLETEWTSTTGHASEPPASAPDGMDGRALSWHGRPVAQVALVALAALLLFGAGYVVAARDRLATWWTSPNAPALSIPVMAPEVTAEPRGSEQVLERARQHVAQGRNQAALRVLSAITADDPLRAAADRLRAEALRALGDRGATSGQLPAGSPTRAQGSALQ